MAPIKYHLDFSVFDLEFQFSYRLYNICISLF
jgi:hypothetical protein